MNPTATVSPSLPRLDHPSVYGPQGRLVLISPSGLSTYNDASALRLLAQARRFKGIFGAYHAWVSAKDADLCEQLIPNARTVIFQDTGHMAMIERPAAFNALLEEFLSE